jgi:hypothetical protein
LTAINISLCGDVGQGARLADYTIPNGIDGPEARTSEFGDATGNNGAGVLVAILDAKRLAGRGYGIPEEMSVINAEESARFECDWHGFTPYRFTIC